MSNILENITDKIIVIAVVAIIFGVISFIHRKNLRAGNILLFAMCGIAVLFLAVIVIALIVLLINAKFHFLF